MICNCWKIGILLIALPLCSCKQDAQLTRTRDEQVKQINDLQDKITMIKQTLSNRPADLASKLNEQELRLQELNESIAWLENQVVALHEKKLAIEKDHEAYRNEYPLP